MKSTPTVKEVKTPVSDQEVEALLDGLEADDIDDVVVDETPATDSKKEKKDKPEKANKPKTEKKEKAESTLDPDAVTVKMIAEQCGCEPRELRNFLRANYTRALDNKNDRWLWKKGDAQIQEIIDTFKAKKAAPRATKKAEETKAEEAAPVAESK